MRVADLPMLLAVVQSAALPVNRQEDRPMEGEEETSVDGKIVLCTRRSVRIVAKKPLFPFSHARIALFTVAIAISPSLAHMLADRAGKRDVSNYC